MNNTKALNIADIENKFKYQRPVSPSGVVRWDGYNFRKSLREVNEMNNRKKEKKKKGMVESSEDHIAGESGEPTNRHGIRDSTLVAMKEQATVVQQAKNRLRTEEARLVDMAVDMVGPGDEKEAKKGKIGPYENEN